MNERIRCTTCLTPDGSPAGTLVVIPTYNERENIAPLFSALAAVPERPDIAIVDDASTDNTASEVRRLAAAYPGRVHLLERTGKHGLGTAYCDAFRWALEHSPASQIILQMDADLSHDPAAIPALIQGAHAHGAAIGSRYVTGGSMPDWKRGRRWLSRAANRYANTVLRLRAPSYRIEDSTAGFAAWRRDILAQLMQRHVPGQGYGFQVSMKWLAHNAGVTPVEHPITFRDRRVGQSKLSKRIVIEGLSIPWRLLRRP